MAQCQFVRRMPEIRKNLGLNGSVYGRYRIPDTWRRACQLFAYESGGLSDDDTIDLFQSMIDSGLVWQLQGSYGRMAQRLIESGKCSRLPLQLTPSLRKEQA